MHESFLKAILERPDDDIPRLVYADWLDEQGDVRAEFIRVQCELARFNAGDPWCDDLRIRERVLLDDFAQDWLGPFASIVEDFQFHRGFVEEICISYSTFERLKNELQSWAPLRRVELNLRDAPLNRSLVEIVFQTIAESRSQRMKIAIPNDIVDFVPESVARENIVLPLCLVGQRLTVAYCVPHASDLFSKIAYILNRRCEYIEVSRDWLVETISTTYGDTNLDFVECVSFSIPDDFAICNSPTATHASTSPITRLVDMILGEALSLRASAVHIEPLADRIRTRFQVQGESVERNGHPQRIHPQVLARLRMLAGLEQSDHFGRFVLQQNERFRARVTFNQTSDGESVVIHISDLPNSTIETPGFAVNDEIKCNPKRLTAEYTE